MGALEKILNRKEQNHLLPFLWVHGEDEATYRKMVRAIHGANIGAFCVEARPHPEFCRDGWWKDMEVLLEEAEKLGMKVWILDDKHFPTGFANGAVKTAPLALHRRHMTHKSIPVKPGQKLHIRIKSQISPKEHIGVVGTAMLLYGNEMRLPKKARKDALLSCTAYGTKERIDLSAFVKDGNLEWTVTEGINSIEFCGLTYDSGFHRSYINMLDKESCRLLLNAVYEPHYAHFKEKFGSVIAGFFSDEPELGNGNYLKHENLLGTDQTLPYSETLAMRLKEVLGEDWAAWMPLLWKNDYSEEETARVRFLYMDCVTRLVQECFSEQIGDWCREHGVEYIGHVIEDNNQHARTSTSLGHYFRGLRGQTMAGIDDIGGQVCPGGEDKKVKNIFGYYNDGEFYHYALGKLGSSMAAITPHMQGRTMCEIFGNYGWGEGVRLEKYLVDHFLVRGVNYFVPHAFTCSPYPEKDCPPHFYAQGNNPQYRHFGKLMAYTNRVCELFCGGHMDAPVAVLYHGEAEWAGKTMMMQKPARILTDHQIGFFFLPPDVFAEPDYYGTKITEGLTVNGMEVELLLIPYMQFITKETAEAVRKLKNRVVFIDALPDGICTGEALPEEIRECKVVAFSDLWKFLSQKSVQKDVIVPENDRIRILHYQDGEKKERYLIVNEGAEIYRGSLELSSDKSFFAYNAWEDKAGKTSRTECNIEITLNPLESLVLIEGSYEELYGRPLSEVPQDRDGKGRQEEAAEEKWRGEKKELVQWKQSICRAKDYPCFSVEKEIRRPGNCALTDDSFSGYIQYKKEIEIRTGAKKNRFIGLEITEAYEGVEVFVNGQSAGIQIVPPFRYDLTKICRDGKNCISIQVATTLERERGNKRTRKNAAPTGIMGKIYLWTGKGE